MSMASATFTLIIGTAMGGIMNRLRLLQGMVAALSQKVRGPRMTVLVSMLASLLGVAVMGDSPPAKILVADAFAEAYDQKNLSRGVLSRTLDMASFGEAFFPWTVGAVYLVTLFGVPVTRYVPFIFFYYFVMLFNVLRAGKPSPRNQG